MTKKKENYVKNSYNNYLPENLENIVDWLDSAMKNFNYLNVKDIGSRVTGFLGIGILVVALYFLAPNFTGNVVANLEVENSNLFGMGLFLFGLLMVFVCLKKK